MSWKKIKIHSGALSYAKENDWDSFMEWVKKTGVSKYIIFDYLREDIPNLLRTGVSRAYYPNTVPNPGWDWSDTLDAFDHSRIYKNTQTGQCWLVSHIYNCTIENIERIREWCNVNGLDISFLKSSWYFPEVTLGVVITPKRE